jgi:signal transduction histidine kinase
MESFLYIISNLIHVYAVYVFIDSFLAQSRLGSALKTATYAAYFISGTVLWTLTNSPMLNLVLNIAAPIMISMQYNDIIAKKIFGAVSSCAVCMFIDWCVLSTIHSSVFSQSGLIQSIAVLGFSFFFRLLQKKLNLSLCKPKYLILLLLSAAATIIMGIAAVNIGSDHATITIAILLIIDMLNFYIYIMAQRNTAAKAKLEMIEELNNIYKEQLYIVSSSYNKVRFLKHDFKKHIERLKELVQDCSREEVLEYLCSIDSAIVEKRQFSFTGNRDIDSLMNYELSLASDLGAEISYTADIPSQLNITSFDMTIILGNLMDNAVYALKNVQERELKVTIKYRKGIVRIDIENTFSPVKKKKNDGSEHGIGLMSVESVLSKYHGRLISEKNGNIYKATVIMYDSIEHQPNI